MNTWLLRLVSPPVFPHDPEKTRVAQILNALLWLILIVWLLALAAMPFVPDPLTGLIVVGSMVLTLLPGLVALHAGHVRPVARIFVIVLWASCTLLTAVSGGIVNPVVAGFAVPIMAAGMLLGALPAVFTAGFSLTALVAIYLFQNLTPAGRALTGEPLLFITPGVALLIASVTLLQATAFLYLMLAYLNRALNNARQYAVELEQERAGLEGAIRQRTQVADAARQEAETARQVVQADAWKSTAQAELSLVMSGEQSLPDLAAAVIRQVCLTLQAQAGVLYIAEEGDCLRLIASYAFHHRSRPGNTFQFGEGMPGQAALEKKTLSFTRVPPGYLAGVSALVQIAPEQVLVAPFLYEGRVLGVVELSLLAALSSGQAEFLAAALNNIGLAFHTARTRGQVNLLLQRTQDQAEALQAANAELQFQAEKLRQQQTDLERTNLELERRSNVLHEQRTALDQQNKDLKTAQAELQRRTAELTLANKYKSEFLANMSHELRTPLNSLLILARLLGQNEAGNLTPDQVESAHIIYKSGSDLLALINEILDLSKVEAGRMTFHFTPVSLENIVQSLHTQFDPVAAERELEFRLTLAPGLPSAIETDQQRLEQILKNLLSNAFKFTDQGAVSLDISRPADDPAWLVFAVTDSGIGMNPEQQQRVFEAFQQADGSTSRRYGGTGLGLSISRELAARLGGRITLWSAPGQGSTFRLHLPITRSSAPLPEAEGLLPALPAETVEAAPASAAAAMSATAATSAAATPPAAPPGVSRPATVPLPDLPDDRSNLEKTDQVLLIIEDDPAFARLVYDYAHQKGFKALLAADGERGLGLARRYAPDAILLDLKLPGISGWDVLDELKDDFSLRHIPVHILSATEETLDAYKRGALGFLSKPVSPEELDSVFQKIRSFLEREIKTLLLVEDDAALRHSVRQLLGGSDLKISEVSQGAAALDLLRRQHFDCMILDLSLPDMTGFELLNRIDRDPGIPMCPVIVYTGQALSEQENAELLKYADSVIIKGVKSPERLLDETALFLHRVVADLSPENRRAIAGLHAARSGFSGKHLLVVDDDMRNAFALSHLLSDKGIKVSIARSGPRALELLAADPQPPVDLVLMDIMMPEMDGYEVMRRIRSQPQFRNLPILALTAKAMKGDQEKCIAAGANDYLSKPIDADHLFSMLRVWLYRS